MDGSDEDLRERIERAGRVLTVPLALYAVSSEPVEAKGAVLSGDRTMVQLSEDDLRDVDARGFPDRVRDRLVDDEVNRGILSTLVEAVPVEAAGVRDLARNASREFNRRVRDRIERLQSLDLASVRDAVPVGDSREVTVADGFSFQDAFNLVQGTSRVIKAVTEAEGSLERRFCQR